MDIFANDGWFLSKILVSGHEYWAKRVPLMHLDQRLEDDKEYGLSLFQPEMEANVNWLNAQEA